MSTPSATLPALSGFENIFGDLATLVSEPHRGRHAARPAMESDSLESAAAPPQGWREWFDEHGHRFLLFARQQTRSNADAEDVLQSAILRVWKGRGKRGQDRQFAPTLAEVYTAIRRAAIDLGRKDTRRTRREQSVVADTVNFGVTPFESDVEDQELKQVLTAALDELPPKFREVLMLKIWGDQTFAAIAEALDIPLNTAASRYRYALNQLRRSLGAQRADLFDHLG